MTLSRMAKLSVSQQTRAHRDSLKFMRSPVKAESILLQVPANEGQKSQ